MKPIVKALKAILKPVVPVSLSALVALGGVVAANAATRKMGDVDGNKRVSITDVTLIQRLLAEMITDETGEITKFGDIDGNGLTIEDVTAIQRYIAEYDDGNGIGDTVWDYEHTYSLNADLLDGTPGVYEVKATKGDRLDGDNAKTIGIPSIAKQNLADAPTEEAPAIIQGAANGFETKTGPVEYTMNNGLSEDDITEPYSKFRHRIIEETVTDADGVTSTHQKLSGFDGTYYIIRVDVSDIIDGKTGYLHVKEESNKAMVVLAGMSGGISTGEPGKNADGTQTQAPHIDAATNHWFVGEKDTGITVGDENPSLSYVDVDGNWCVGGTCFVDNTGNNTRVYSLADNAKALKDTSGSYQTKPYIDVIVMSSGKLVAGADTGTSAALSADIKLSMYVDGTRDYNPDLTYDPTSQDVNHATNVMAKFYKAEAFTDENNAASYTVMGSDLEIDVATQNGDATEYWSMTKAIAYPEYDSHTIKIICEVPVLEGLKLEGASDNPRNVILDVNSFDIQVANHAASGAAGLTVEHDATLTITDNSNTSGAELAIGNNASMEVMPGGTLIISETCQLEVEYDAATTTQGSEGEQGAGGSTPLTNGVITVRPGGTIINRGVINIEGLEVKPLQPNTQEQEQQQAVNTDMKASSILVEDGGVLDNYGCISLKGNLYVMGKINNYGKYADVITAQDPDKGSISYHKGIQLTWKDDVTVLNEGTNTYSVNPDVLPGALFIGKDGEGNVVATAQINNFGDIVLVPGVLNVFAEFNNRAGDEYSGHLYVCAVTEAVVPITPDPNDPTKTEERRELAEPYPSVINKDSAVVFRNEGVVAEASVKVLSNGVLGDLTVIREIELN